MLPARLNEYEHFYETAKEKCIQHLVHADEPIVVCNLEDVKENLGGYYGRVKIFNDIIYLKPESYVHVIARTQIPFEINHSLPNEVKESFNFMSTVVPIFNRYACGSIHIKYPDFNFVKGDDEKNVIIAGEIFFRHEKEQQMLLEAINYLTEFTTVKLVIIVQLPRHNRNGFYMRLILFQRSVDCDPDKKKILEDALKEGRKKFDQCIKIECPMNILEWKNDESLPALFGILPITVIEYSADDYDAEKPVNFEIPGSIFECPEAIPIKINFEKIRRIKSEWELHTQIHP